MSYKLVSDAVSCRSCSAVAFSNVPLQPSCSCLSAELATFSYLHSLVSWISRPDSKVRPVSVANVFWIR